MVKIIANFKAVEGWGEKEICTKGVGDGPREWGDINYISPFPTPYPTVFSKSKSNMAGRINDRELVTLTRPYCRLHPAGRNIACLIGDLRQYSRDNYQFTSSQLLLFSFPSFTEN